MCACLGFVPRYAYLRSFIRFEINLTYFSIAQYQNPGYITPKSKAAVMFGGNAGADYLVDAPAWPKIHLGLHRLFFPARMPIVTAKSVTGITTPGSTMGKGRPRVLRSRRFFVPACRHGGPTGLPSGRPAPLVAGGSNPVWPVSLAPYYRQRRLFPLSTKEIPIMKPRKSDLLDELDRVAYCRRAVICLLFCAHADAPIDADATGVLLELLEDEQQRLTGQLRAALR